MNSISNPPPFPDGKPPFLQLLSTHAPWQCRWEQRDAAANELDCRHELFVTPSFPAPEHLLDTAIASCRRFLAETGLQGTRLPITLSFVDGFQEEQYECTVTPAGIDLKASDREGIRRAVYFLMDQLRKAPFIAYQTTRRTPWLKNRISRCFFGPIKRPPHNIDELTNSIDYYPEEYLERLAHEGINGLWLTVEFREICETSLRKAPPEAAIRLEKLRRTVEKCRRYGIKTWVFCIEPQCWRADNPLPQDLRELCGPGYSAAEAGEPMESFCPQSQAAQQYLYECSNSLFKAVPHLGGMITIAYGERVTSCLSTILEFSDGEIRCSKRCAMTPGEILQSVLAPLSRGMRDANPEAQLISWLYIPYSEQVGNWLTELPSKLSEDTTIAFNFESGVTKRQLDKPRAGGDYWLSAIGPSDRFVSIAQSAQGHCQLAAKLQVACSHECATVPEIPVPGLLYKKYKQMKALGVSSVMQCWYFGNYPGIMNETAGQLAFEDFSTSEEDFLLSLAKTNWGMADAPKMVQAWKCFEEGYQNYPLDIQFQYFGPMHSAPAWALHLYQSLTCLPRSWKPDAFPAGDVLGECMKHFTLAELVELTRRMNENWQKGLDIMHQIPQTGHELEFSLAETLGILFASGHNVLEFYGLRNALLDGSPEAPQLLNALREILLEEKQHSLQLASLCERDPRIGYHSEAEVFQFYPEKLTWRAALIQDILDNQLPQLYGKTAADIAAALAASSADGALRPETTYVANGISWTLHASPTELRLSLHFENSTAAEERISLFFLDKNGEKPPIVIIFPRPDNLLNKDCWEYEIRISRARLSYASKFYFGVERAEYSSDGTARFSNDKTGEFSHEYRLYLDTFDPQKLRLIDLTAK